jgi:hypothetical protein
MRWMPHIHFGGQGFVNGSCLLQSTPLERPSLEKRLGISDLVIDQILLLCHCFSSRTNFIMVLNLSKCAPGILNHS